VLEGRSCVSAVGLGCLGEFSMLLGGGHMILLGTRVLQPFCCCAGGGCGVCHRVVMCWLQCELMRALMMVSSRPGGWARLL